MKERKLLLALGVISGRIDAESLDFDQYEDLGYDSYRFRSFGAPSRNEILEHAEWVLLNAILGDDSESDAN